MLNHKRLNYKQWWRMLGLEFPAYATVCYIAYSVDGMVCVDRRKSRRIYLCIRR